MKKVVIFILSLFISTVTVAQNGYRVEIKQVFPKSGSVYSNAFNFKREMDNAISTQTAKLNGNCNYQIMITTPSDKETRNIQNINWIQTVNGIKSFHKNKTSPNKFYDVATVWEGYSCNIDGSRKGKAEKKEFVYRVTFADTPNDFKTAFVDLNTAKNEAIGYINAALQEELVEVVIYRFDTDVPSVFHKESNREQHNAYLAKLEAEKSKEIAEKSKEVTEKPKENVVVQNPKKEHNDTTSTMELKKPLVIKKDPTITFITLNGGYTNTENLSVGLTFGQVKKFGWFASVMTGFNYDGFDLAMPVSDAEGFVGESFPFYKDEYAKTVFSVMGGGVMRLNDMIYVKAGLGFGNRSLSWKTLDSRWVRNGGYSAVGLDASVGAMFILKNFVVSLDGVVTTNFSNVIFEGRIGLGYSFNL